MGFIFDTMGILSESEIGSVDRLIAQMVIIDNTPISFVSKHGFRNLMKVRPFIYLFFINYY